MDARDRAVLEVDRFDRAALDADDARVSCALRHRPRQIARTDLTIRRQERRADEIGDVHQRPELERFLRRQKVHLQSEAAGGRRLAAHFCPPLRVAGEPQPAVLTPSGGLPGLLLELVVEFDAVLQQLRDARRAAELSDESRRVERRSAGQLPTLEDDDVAVSQLRQVVAHAAPHDPASDDDGLRVGR